MSRFEVVKGKEVHEQRRRESRESRVNTEKSSLGGPRSIPEAVSSDVREDDQEEEKVSPESRGGPNAITDSLTYSVTMPLGLDDKAFRSAGLPKAASRNRPEGTEGGTEDLRKEASGWSFNQAQAPLVAREMNTMLTNESVFGVRPDKESEEGSARRLPPMREPEAPDPTVRDVAPQPSVDD